MNALTGYTQRFETILHGSHEGDRTTEIIVGIEARQFRRDALGVQLINRTTRRMTLTDAGQRFYGECNRLLAELNEVEADVTAAEAALTGRIRLAAPPVFGTKHLGPAINAFLGSHPNIQFDIKFNDRQIDIIE